MYQIGMFSKLGKVTVKTLRYYDELGLLKPAKIDKESGYRYYATSQLYELSEITALKQMGFNLAETAAILKQDADATQALKRGLASLYERRRTIDEHISRLQNYINERDRRNKMPYQAVIGEIPACTVFSVRKTIPDYGALMEIMPAVGAKVKKANPGLQCTRPDYCFNVYLDGEFKESDIDVEICQAVTARGKDCDDIVFKEMPAITAVRVLHRGPYEKLSAAYAYAIQWVEQNDYLIDGLIRESYIDGIWNKRDPEEWLTEIQVPVRKNSVIKNKL